MADIFHDVPIKATTDRVFQAISTPEGLDRWWTKQSVGTPETGQEYQIGFGPEYQWTAKVTRCTPNSDFEFKMLQADGDWAGTRIGFRLEFQDPVTWVRFYHTGWPSLNEHFRISCNCWAMYLRILRRWLEHGESVPYEDRLNV